VRLWYFFSFFESLVGGGAIAPVLAIGASAGSVFHRMLALYFPYLALVKPSFRSLLFYRHF
jgi:H+/Cl- antiporter ClcA